MILTRAALLSKLTPGVTTYGEACSKLLTKPLDSNPLTTIPYSGDEETIPMSYRLKWIK